MEHRTIEPNLTNFITIYGTRIVILSDWTSVLHSDIIEFKKEFKNNNNDVAHSKKNKYKM